MNSPAGEVISIAAHVTILQSVVGQNQQPGEFVDLISMGHHVAIKLLRACSIPFLSVPCNTRKPICARRSSGWQNRGQRGRRRLFRRHGICTILKKVMVSCESQLVPPEMSCLVLLPYVTTVGTTGWMLKSRNALHLAALPPLPESQIIGSSITGT